MRERWPTFVIMVSLGVAVSFGALDFWRLKQSHRLTQAATAGEAIEDQDTAEMLTTLEARSRATVRARAAARFWEERQIAALEGEGNLSQLLQFHKRHPEGFHDNESAALLVARGLLGANALEDLADLRADWRGRETRTEAWQLLDSDTLFRTGKRGEAFCLLQRWTGINPDDPGRLARLARLIAPFDRAGALTLLGRFDAHGPAACELHALRGETLEALGRTEAAGQEYLAAVRSNPRDILVRDQLAEFYRRTGTLELAQSTWLYTPEVPVSDSAWLKIFFWDRVMCPLARQWKREEIPPGRLHTLLTYLLNLGPEEFWNADAFSRMHGAQGFLQESQETFWLRVLAALQDHHEKAALELLRNNPFHDQSWNPDLERALYQLMAFRCGAAAEPSRPGADGEASGGKVTHPFFGQLNALARQGLLTGRNEALPRDQERFLRSDEAVAAALLAGGWKEAALRFLPGKTFSQGTPDWVTQSVHTAHPVNHGSGTTLAMAPK